MKRLLIEEDTSTQPKPCTYSRKLVLKIVLNIIYPTCIIFPTVCICTICWRNGMDSLYSWHLLLTGIGFHLTMPIGISSLRVQQLLPCWSCSRKTVHWLLQSVASACVLIGVVLQYINREMKHKHHFTTLHSIVGLLSVVLVVVSLVGGVVALSGWEVRKLVSTVWLYRVHRAVGTAAFLAGMVTLALAYEKHNFKKSFSKDTRFALTIATGIAVVITLLGVFKKFTSFCKNAVPSDSILDDA